MSLKLSEHNFHDMNRVYVLRFEAKSQVAQPTNAYEQFKTVVGQYARFCFVKNAVEPEKNMEQRRFVFLSIRS